MTLRYILVKINIPPGWTIEERYNSQRSLKPGLGTQSAPYPHLNTVLRPNAPTSYDDEGSILDAGDCFIMRGEFSSEEMTLDYIAQIVADEVGVSLEAAKSKVTVETFGGKDCTAEESHTTALDYLDEHKSEWGE